MQKIAIIGGGINGLFISWRLSKIGYEVDLYESKKVLSQTSSSSSKLLHGGIRYLEQGHLGLVRESLLDRFWWIQNAPDYSKKIQICIPIYNWSERSLPIVYAGAQLYRTLAGRYSLGPSKFFNKKNAVSTFSEISKTNLLGAVSFYDAQMDEGNLGRWVCDNTKNSGTKIYENTKIDKFTQDGELFLDNNKKQYDLIINAAGPWAADLNKKNNIKTNYYLRLIRGSHLILEKTSHNSFLFQEPNGKRVVFVLPYLGKTLIGTTEVPQKLNEEIKCSELERNYLLCMYNKHFKDKLNQRNIISEFSGLRPIVESNNTNAEKYFSFASREAKIEKIGKIISIYGGKWTSAPSLSKKVVKMVSKVKYD